VSYTKTYWERRYTRKSFRWPKLELAAKFSRRKTRERVLALLQAYEGRLDILSLPYWTRMWTYQEYYLPKDEPVCLCGRLRFRGTSIDEVASILNPDTDDARTRNHAFKQGSSKTKDEEIEKQYQVLVKKMEGDGPGSMRPTATDLKSEAFKLNLSKLMISTSARRCLDPRDKVFALYGIASKAREVHPPDYSKPLEQVYHEATVFMILHERYLPFSTFGIRRENQPPESSSPS